VTARGLNLHPQATLVIFAPSVGHHNTAFSHPAAVSSMPHWIACDEAPPWPAPTSPTPPQTLSPCLPQHRHLPSDVTAAAWRTPPSQCTKDELCQSRFGVVHIDHSLPSLSRAMLCSCPAAMNAIGATLVSRVGSGQRGNVAGSPLPSWPFAFQPQLQIVPSIPRASWSGPIVRRE
jgi:hypothetical protein